MKKLYSIGDAAAAAGMTAETLRHYDRIGLVKPSRKDEWTGYRYYSEADLVRLRTVRALQRMDLPLKEIRAALELDDLREVARFLADAERKADAKIAGMLDARRAIRAARRSYEGRPNGEGATGEVFVREIPARTILVHDRLREPTLETLWSYLRHFYAMIGPERKDRFAFEDVAGVYTEGGVARMFAVCSRHERFPGIREIPAGPYLCANCEEEARHSALRDLEAEAVKRTGAAPGFMIQQVVVTGILRWSYQLQAPVGTAGTPGG